MARFMRPYLCCARWDHVAGFPAPSPSTITRPLIAWPGIVPLRSAELATPDVHFGAADVGLRHLGDDAGRRGGNVILVEGDFVGGGNKGDASFHGGCFC